jgi:uncharacterized protein (UPF0332 family)
VTTAEFLKKADAALASARRDLAAADLDGAANRLYHAMFHAARAALAGIGHATMIARFGLRFCKDGPLPTELGRALNEAQELRLEGDYGTATAEAAEVAAYVAKAEQFVAAVKGIVSRTTQASSG